MRYGELRYLNAFLLLLALGIIAARYFPLPLKSAAPLSAILLLSAIIAKQRARMIFVGAVFFVVGMARFTAVYDLPADDISNYHGKTVTVSGIVDEAPRITEAADGTLKIRLNLAADAVRVGGERKAAGGGCYVFSRAEKGEFLPPQIGDRVDATGTVHLPHRFNNPGQIDTVMLLRSQGISATLFAGNGLNVTADDGHELLRFVAAVRAFYLDSLEKAMPKTDAAAIFAMLFGGYTGVSPELTESFTATGLVHILSVSGSHISLLAAFAAWLGKVLRLSAWGRLTLGLVAILGYALLAGPLPPVIRSAVMGALVFFAVAFRRERSSARFLALTAFFMLLASPLLLFHISFQLSFAATFGIIYLYPAFWSRLSEKKPLQRPLFGNIVQGILLTASIELMSLPLLAWYFQQISLSAFIANIIVLPLVEFIIVTALLAGLVAFFLPFIGQAVFTADSIILGLVFEMCRLLAALPLSFVYIAPLPPAVLIVYALALTVLLLPPDLIEKFDGRLPSWRRGLLMAGIICLAFGFGKTLTAPKELAVHFIDVGQGSAALIVTPNGHAFMIDTGGVRDGLFDVGARVDIPYLFHCGVRRLDAVFLTHAHEDHAAGAGSILKKLPVGKVITGNEPLNDYARSLNVTASDPLIGKLKNADGGEKFTVDGVDIDVLYAPQPRSNTGNEASVVYRVGYGNASFLFTGDLTAEQEKNMLNERIPVKSTVLAVAHHGSNTSSSKEFLHSAAPKWAVISVGAENSFGHPRAEVLNRLAETGTTVLRTDEDGAVVFYTDGSKIRAETYCGRKAVNRS